MVDRIPFWKNKSLDEMAQAEWESLCDGCGRCCFHKLEDDETGEIHYTNVACRLLSPENCRCVCYDHRLDSNPDCLVLTPDKVKPYHWLPSTCAYRLLFEGKELEWWHPLVSDDPETVHKAGISVRDKVISEKYVHRDQLLEHVID